MLQWALGFMYPLRLCFSSDICPGVEFQDHMVAQFSGWKNLHTVPHRTVPIYISNNNIGGFFSLHTISIICDFFFDDNFLFCSIDLYFYLCASSIPITLQHNLKSGSLIPPALLCFLKIALLFRIFCVNTRILIFLVLVLWKMSLVIWLGLHWINQ